MKLGVLSDSHNHLERTEAAVEILLTAGAETLIHCGDVGGPEIVIACAVRPFYFVFGNNDGDLTADLERTAAACGAICLRWGDVIELAGKRIGVFHGHLTTDRRRIEALQPDYILSGHSHVPSDVRDGAIRRINPGALYRAAEFTVALLDLKTDELSLLTVPR